MMASQQAGVVDAELEDAPGQPAMPQGGQGLDLDAITRQAQQMLDANPELKRQLLAQLGALGGPDDSDDDPDKK